MNMKLGYTGWALGLVAAAGLLAAGYHWGARQDHGPGASGQGVSPVADAVAGERPDTGAAMPPGHPSLQTTGAAAGMGVPFTHFRVGNRNVKSMRADGDIIWIGTSGGVIRYDTKQDQYRLFDNQVPGILSNGVFHVNKLGGKVLAGTYGGGLSVYDPKAETWTNYNIPDGLADQFVYDTHTARNGDLWIATWSGANRVRGAALDDPARWDTFTVENTGGGLPNPWVYAMDEAPDGTMWFATEAGLARYRDGKWRHWQHADGLGAPYEEVRESIQFTSDPAQASQHHAQQKAEQGLQGVDVAYNPNYIISLVVDNQGVVWCGTWGGGLARFDGKTWRNYTTKDGLPANHIFMLSKDPRGRLWIGTSRGVARFKDGGEGFVVLTAADGLYAENVFSMAYAADGSVWIGSYGGVARLARLQ